MNVLNCCWLIGNTSGSWPENTGDGDDLPALMRRRLSPLGRQALQTVFKSYSHIGRENISWVVACRDGDAFRRIDLLSSLAKDEMLSPTDFSMSVHNAIIGMFSIFTGNKHNHTALAGGESTFESGLLEAIALQMDKAGSVGYVYYDYLDSDNQDTTHQVKCVAMVLGNGNDELTIRFSNNSDVGTIESFDINNLLEYLKDDEQTFRVPVAGGEILFERPL